MIKDEEAEAAAEYIRDSAPTLAESKANRVYLEQFRKSKKAMLMMEAKASMVKSTVDQREAYAYAHEEYLLNLEGLRGAVEMEEKIKWKMKAAELTIEIWRTEQANLRAQDRAHQ